MENNYARIVSAVGTFLKDLGYSRKGSSFVAPFDCNVAIVNFQKSRGTRTDSVLFTINLGVYCNRISRILNNTETAAPDIWECHLRQRIGWLLSTKDDKWWTVDSTTDIAIVVNELWSILDETGLPYLRRFLSDEALRDLWTAGSSPGLTDMQRLMNLSTISRARGWEACFQMACDQLRAITNGRPQSAAAEGHIRMLERTTS